MPAKSSAKKPRKPYPEYPLFAHANGSWAKKIKGKFYYFGPWDDPTAALDKFKDEVDDINAGRDPRMSAGVVEVSGALTVADLLNLYLADLEERKDRKEITPRHFADSKKSCELTVKHFGRRVEVQALRAKDFDGLMNSFPADHSPHTIGNHVTRIKAVFKWGFASERIDKVPNYGTRFKKPEKRQFRRHRQQREDKRGKLVFTSSEAWRLVAASSGYLKACILLGLNAGFGAADCARIKKHHVDFETGIYDLPRGKTGTDRTFFLWQQSRDAIREVMAEDGDLCFRTREGRPVWWESENGRVADNVGVLFQKLSKELGIFKAGRGFYSLRRTYETVAGNTKDQVIVNLAMGHVDESTADTYRQGVDPRRLIDVADHVENWLIGGQPTKK